MAILTTQQAQTYANAINSWLDLHGDLATLHSSSFSPIHKTTNFFPWHRAHIRELEESLGIALPEVLLRWRPQSEAGEPGNAMPEPFRLTNDNPQLSGMPDPDPLVPIPGGIVLPDACSQGLGIDDFSNLVQSSYHDLVHNAVGGLFLSQEFSATVIGFWPWHAWVDEFWYNWENTCTAGYTDFPASGMTEIVINSTVNWTGERFVKGKIIIENGGRLNIAPGAVIHFRSSDYEAYETSILVKPGGLLYVDNATLSGIDRFGTNIGGTGGVQYFSGWKGIRVEGTGTFSGNSGQITLLNNSIVEHASIGIESVGGGRIVAENSSFLNNRECVSIRDFNFSNHFRFHIENCTFDFTAPLRDVTWTPAEGLQPRHFLHNIPQSPRHYVLFNNIKGAKIIGGSFNKSLVISGEPTTGVTASNARFSCTNGVAFAQSLDIGIAVMNTSAGLVGDPKISGCTINAQRGIQLNGVDYATISNNSFNNLITSIEARGASGYDITDNAIAGGPAAVSVLSDASSGNHANVIERNTFNGGNIQLQFQFGNPDVQFRCNDFNNPGLYAAALMTSNLADQGSCDLGLPAGNLFDACTGSEQHLFRSTIAGTYKYSTHNDRVPTCVSQGIGVESCQFLYSENPTCEVAQPCLTCPEFPEETDIAAKEAQKQFWAGSSLPPEEIDAIIRQLTWEQKIIAQRGLLRVMESDTTLATAFQYLGEVGAVFPFPASDRISLYLATGNLTAANALIDALPAGNQRILFSLLATLLVENRDYQQLSPGEIQTVHAIAQGDDQSSAQAKSILYLALGEEVVIEPISAGGGQGFVASPTEQPNAVPATLRFYPNPGAGAVTVRYSLDTPDGRATFTLTDLFGRQVLTAPMPHSEFRLNLGNIPTGAYFGTITVDGKRLAVSKLAVIR